MSNTLMESITVNGKSYEWESVVHIMDDEIREAVHCDLAPCTNKAFYDEYVRRREAAYPSESFAENVRATCAEVRE